MPSTATKKCFAGEKCVICLGAELWDEFVILKKLIVSHHLFAFACFCRIAGLILRLWQQLDRRSGKMLQRGCETDPFLRGSWFFLDK